MIRRYLGTGLLILLVVTLAGVVLASRSARVVSAQADIRAQWARSGHANRQLAREEATVEARGATAAHCASCHAEQGYLAWLPQLEKGNPGLITRPDGSPADVGYLSTLGLNRFSVRPVTCAACHTPDLKVRVTATTPVLPAGFRALGVGLGAQCMTCHNTRNGAIVWNAEDPRRWTAPHTAAQADVLMGKNAFFVPPAEASISPHASFIGDSCVTCHMRFSKESHTFKPAEGTCLRCHGAEVTPARVKAGIQTLLHEVEAAIARRVMAAKDRIAVIRHWDPQTDQYTDNVRIDPAQIVSVELVEIHGQQGLKFNRKTGGAWYSQMGSILDAAGKPVFATSDPIVRAGWNYFLIEGDDSFGVHNPRFARTVLLATLEALK
jgi:cytochrome c556